MGGTLNAILVKVDGQQAARMVKLSLGTVLVSGEYLPDGRHQRPDESSGETAVKIGAFHEE